MNKINSFGALRSQKGVFITLTAFMLSLLLLFSAANLQKVRGLEENALTLSIAAQDNYFVKKNLYDIMQSAYFDAGIFWDVNDNNALLFRETFPQITQKTKLSQNLADIKAYFYNEFPNGGTYTPETTDIGEINIAGKDLNIKHSLTSGFGTNNQLYFNFSQKKFNTVRFDINSDKSSLAVYGTPNIPLCIACANPLNMIITIRNSAGGISYSFNNMIDLSQAGNLDLNSSPNTPDIQLVYTPTSILWTTNASILTFYSITNFNDPLFDIYPDKNAVNITELSSFGIQG